MEEEKAKIIFTDEKDRKLTSDEELKKLEAELLLSSKPSALDGLGDYLSTNYRTGIDGMGSYPMNAPEDIRAKTVFAKNPMRWKAILFIIIGLTVFRILLFYLL